MLLQELIEKLGQKLSGDLEDIVPALLKKAADVSTAGRENFLTQYADAALSQMILSCSEAPTAKALLSMCAHRSQSPACFSPQFNYGVAAMSLRNGRSKKPPHGQYAWLD